VQETRGRLQTLESRLSNKVGQGRMPTPCSHPRSCTAWPVTCGVQCQATVARFSLAHASVAINLLPAALQSAPPPLQIHCATLDVPTGCDLHLQPAADVHTVLLCAGVC
jgi:hypothetical protein